MRKKWLYFLAPDGGDAGGGKGTPRAEDILFPNSKY